MIVFLLAVPMQQFGASGNPTGPAPDFQDALRHSPFPFEPNRGQTDPSVRFLARAGNYRLFLTDEEVVCASGGGVSRFQFKGAGASHWEPQKKLPGVTSYFIGADSSKWLPALPQYGGVKRKNLYEGIDVEFLGEGHRIEYRFTVAPGALPANIRLLFADAHPTVQPNGDLVLRLPDGEVRHRAPVAFQNNRRVPVAFQVNGDDEVMFDVPDFDPTLPLVIDPVISVHFFHGGLSNDTATGGVIGPTGDFVYAGRTGSLDFPVAGSPYRDYNSGNIDIFIARINPSGNWVFSTYIGGSGRDEANALAVDQFGNSNIAATTTSTDLPVQTGVFQPTYGGNEDAVAIKVSSTGFNTPLITYLGGSGRDLGLGVAVDSTGAAFYTGYTSSTDFPTKQAHQASFGGGANDMFIVKIHAGGSEVVFSTYFGGDADDQAYAVATDKDGNPVLTGRSTCSLLPVGASIGPLGGIDGFVMKWRGTGQGAIYITCFGGNGVDSGYAVTLDAAGNTYVTGATSSINFPIVAAVQQVYGGTQDGTIGDAFVLKLNPFGTSAIYSTFLGGLRDDVGQSVQVNEFGEAFIAGTTRSPNFPSLGPPLVLPSDRAGFLVRLSANGLALMGSWFFNGVNADDRFSAVLDPKSNVYICGGAAPGIQLPVAAAAPIRAFTNPVQDALIMKLSNSRLQVYQETFSPLFVNNLDFELVQRVVNRGEEAAEHVTFRGVLPAGLNAVSCFATGVTCSTTANSYRVDIPQLAVGSGVEVRATLRPNANAFPGVAQQVSLSATSDTYDPHTIDNFLTTTLFGATSLPPCSYALSTQSVDLPATAASVTIHVSAPLSCPWTATSPTEWLNFASPNTASGTANITFNFTANTQPLPRIGSAIVAGQRVLFQQAAAGDPQAPFSDVAADHPFALFITLMKAKGVTLGCTSTEFCPDALTSRGQMAVFLVRSVLGSDSFSYPSAPYFTDVPATHPQFRYIQKLRDLGITAGCTTTTYCPDSPVTRSQMAAFLVRGRLAVGPNQAFPYPASFSFGDVPANGAFYPSIQKMRELGITLGCTTNLYCPENPTTRAEMSAFLMRAFFAP